MTNTEAINILEGAKVIVINRRLDEFQEAIIKAINALYRGESEVSE